MIIEFFKFFKRLFGRTETKPVSAKTICHVCGGEITGPSFFYYQLTADGRGTMEYRACKPCWLMLGEPMGRA